MGNTFTRRVNSFRYQLTMLLQLMVSIGWLNPWTRPFQDQQSLFMKVKRLSFIYETRCSVHLLQFIFMACIKETLRILMECHMWRNVRLQLAKHLLTDSRYVRGVKFWVYPKIVIPAHRRRSSNLRLWHIDNDNQLSNEVSLQNTFQVLRLSLTEQTTFSVITFVLDVALQHLWINKF